MKKGVVVVLVSVIVVLFGTGIFFYNKYSEEINLIQELERDANILFAQGVTGPEGCDSFSSCVDYCNSNHDDCVQFCENNSENEVCLLFEDFLESEDLENYSNYSSDIPDTGPNGNATGEETEDDESNEEESEPVPTCSYTFRDDTICIGEEGIADLIFTANAECGVEFRYNGGLWQDYDDILLDAQGEEVLRDTPEFAGEYIFRMVCIDSDDNLCSDEDTIVVEDCEPEEEPIEYYCEWSWPQKIINKNTSEVLWPCTLDRPYCNSGTTYCCKYNEETEKHYDCIDMAEGGAPIADPEPIWISIFVDVNNDCFLTSNWEGEITQTGNSFTPVSEGGGQTTCIDLRVSGSVEGYWRVDGFWDPISPGGSVTYSLDDMPVMSGEDIYVSYTTRDICSQTPAWWRCSDEWVLVGAGES